MNIREALTTDISILASHHRRMFEEIWRSKGEALNPEIAIGVENAYSQKLELELTAEICKAWVAEDERKIVSSGAITFISLVPNPSDLSPRVAYLHSLYTEKGYRNRKYSQRIIQRVIAYCKSNGINRVQLNASAAGRPVYEKMGFKPAPDSMRLFLNGYP